MFGSFADFLLYGNSVGVVIKDSFFLTATLICTVQLDFLAQVLSHEDIPEHAHLSQLAKTELNQEKPMSQNQHTSVAT